MRVGSYSLLVPEGVERSTGHVEVPHGTRYTLRIGNHDHRRCDAEVTIDGVTIGVFRLNGHQTAVVERKPDDRGRFTFYAADSADGAQAGAALISTDLRGLVQVKFTPGRPEFRPTSRPQIVRSREAGEVILTSALRGGPGGQSQGGRYSTYAGEQLSFSSENKASAGITGLSGHSYQEFSEAAPMDLDHAAAVTISVRLVVGPGVNAPRPLAARGNPVPDPVA